MKRTTGALKRFAVPVLAVTSVLTAGQIALGTSAFAAANGTLTFAPDPGSGSATPLNAGGDTIQQTVTYTSGTQSGAQANQAQVITLTVGGSAVFVAPTNPNPAGQPVIAGNGKSATCTTAAPVGAPGTAAASCNFAVKDTVSEAVTVTAHDSTDQTTPDASVQDRWAALNFNGCATLPNSPANCVTQQAAGSTVTYTVTYLEAGAPAAGKEVDFAICDTGAGCPGNNNTTQANFPTSQPAGTTATTASTARCTTDAQGHCSVAVQSNGQSNTSSLLSAQTANTAPYPASTAAEQINHIASATPGRFTQTGTTTIRPTPTTPVPAVNEPGDVIQNTYHLAACQANTTSGKNVCLEGASLAGQQVSLSVDHGFFTPNCTKNALTNYANCTFNTTPAAGTPVGDLKSLGTTTTATSDANGNVTVSLGIARDQAFDQNGNLIAQVTATIGGVTLVESVPGQSNTPITCNAPGSNPQAGCPTGSGWTTNAAPLNGGTVSIVSIPNPNNATEPALDATKTNNVPNNQNRVFVLHLTDQFGNLTSGGNASGVTLTKTGVGDLQVCNGYSGGNSCFNPFNGGQNTTDASGSTTTKYTNVPGSYTATFDNNANPVQVRFQATAAPFNGGVAQTGTQTITASWAAPVTTFNTFAAGPPAVATYSTSTATKTATVTINWFKQTAQAILTFTTTPSNKVRAGTVVTVSATVKDQFGNPINNANVAFARSGPTTGNGTSCTATQAGVKTNQQGQAGFSFTCQNPSNQTVTIVVTDASGNELARGTQPITFSGTTTTRRQAVSVKLSCFSRHKHKVTCVAQLSKAFSGVTVVFFDGHGNKVGSDATNAAGKAFLHLRGLKSGKHHKYQAHAKRSPRTFAADSRFAGVTVK